MAFAAAAMPIISIFTSLAGGIFGMMGANAQAQAQANMYNYQAQVAQRNAQIAEQNAQYERQAGEVAAQQAGIKGKQQESMVRAAFGATGIDVNSGTASAVQDSQSLVTQEDEALQRSNAERRAYDYKVQKFQDLSQSNLDTFAASNALESGKIAGISSLIGSFGSVANKWTQFNQLGMLDMNA